MRAAFFGLTLIALAVATLLRPDYWVFALAAAAGVAVIFYLSARSRRGREEARDSSGDGFVAHSPSKKSGAAADGGDGSDGGGGDGGSD